MFCTVAGLMHTVYVYLVVSIIVVLDIQVIIVLRCDRVFRYCGWIDVKVDVSLASGWSSVLKFCPESE